jgi:hypothetical protein
MNRIESGTKCPVFKHQYYPEDKSTYRACTICAARDMRICSVCNNPYATLGQVA